MARNLSTVLCVLVLSLAGIALAGAGSVSQEGAATPIKIKGNLPSSVTPLGRTVELTFRLKSQQPQTLTVTSATTKYGIEVRFAGAAAAAHIELSGDLQLQPPGKSGSAERLLITCQALIGYDAEATIDSYIVASVVTEFGKEAFLVKFGELTLTVEAKAVN